MGPYDTPVLDDFNRANEDPVSQGGNWVGRAFSAIGHEVLQVIGNQLGPNNANVHSAVYDLTFANGVVFATVDALGSTLILFARTAGEGGVGTFSGYGLTWSVSSGEWVFQRITDGVATNLGPSFSVPALAAGDAIGLATIGPFLEFWHRPAAAEEFALVAREFDETYVEGRVAVLGVGSGLRLDDFGAARFAPGKVREGGQWVDAVKRVRVDGGWSPVS